VSARFVGFGVSAGPSKSVVGGGSWEGLGDGGGGGGVGISAS
jgi:hypothetical protein